MKPATAIDYMRRKLNRTIIGATEDTEPKWNRKKQSLSSQRRRKKPTKKQCFSCKELENGNENSHDTKYGYLKESSKKEAKRSKRSSKKESDDKNTKNSSLDSDEKEKARSFDLEDTIDTIIFDHINISNFELRNTKYAEQTLSNEEPKDEMEKVVNERLTKIKMDPENQLTATSKNELKEIIKLNKEIFRSDLPRHNYAYRRPAATFEGTTKARPLWNRARMPNYNVQGIAPYNKRERELLNLEVLRKVSNWSIEEVNQPPDEAGPSTGNGKEKTTSFCTEKFVDVSTIASRKTWKEIQDECKDCRVAVRYFKFGIKL
jgi:hypothetical protein